MGIEKVSKDFYIFILMLVSLGSSLPAIDYAVSSLFGWEFNIYGIGIFSFLLFFICLMYITIRAKKGRLNLDFLVRYENEPNR